MKKHGFDVRTLAAYVFAMAIIMSVLQAGKSGVEFGIVEYSNTSYWFEYDKIESSEIEYNSSDNNIFMKSYSKWKVADIPIVWVDNLFCNLDDGNGLRFISSQVNNGTSKITDFTQTPEVWQMTLTLPDKDALCQIRSSITAKLPSKNKTQHIDSNFFHVIKK